VTLNPTLPFDLGPTARNQKKPSFVLEKADSGYYLFVDSGKQQQQFVVGIKSPTTALQLLRQNPPFTFLVNELLNWGVSFHTFALHRHPPTPDKREIPPSIWLGTRQPSLNCHEEYEQYVAKRDLLLLDPPVYRAALCQGGILWRLASRSDGFNERVRRGPSPKAMLYGFVGGTWKGKHLVDDNLLSMEEEAIIVGMYQVDGRSRSTIRPP
jgi:hypothetical protein